MVSVGLGELGVEASMSHLMSHASFKAGLFLAAGVVITSAGGYPTSKSQVNTYSMGYLCMLNPIMAKPSYKVGLTYIGTGQSTLFNNSTRSYTTGSSDSTLDKSSMEI